MEYGEKLLKLIQEAGYKRPKAFWRALKAMHGEYAITHKTLYNVLNGTTPPRLRTISQIALTLGIKTSDLLTEDIQKVMSQKDGFYSYDTENKASLYTYKLEKPLSVPFLPLKLCLRKDGKTPEEYDPPEAQESVKWIYVVVGEITIRIQKKNELEEKTLHRGQTFAFDARNKHQFINIYKNNSIVLIMHYPAENNSLYLNT